VTEAVAEPAAGIRAAQIPSPCAMVVTKGELRA